jgi:hypothetical protein
MFTHAITDRHRQLPRCIAWPWKVRASTSAQCALAAALTAVAGPLPRSDEKPVEELEDEEGNRRDSAEGRFVMGVVVGESGAPSFFAVVNDFGAQRRERACGEPASA